MRWRKRYYIPSNTSSNPFTELLKIKKSAKPESQALKRMNSPSQNDLLGGLTAKEKEHKTKIKASKALL